MPTLVSEAEARQMDGVVVLGSDDGYRQQAYKRSLAVTVLETMFERPIQPSLSTPVSTLWCRPPATLRTRVEKPKRDPVRWTAERRAWVVEQYEVLHRTQKDIAAELGVSPGRVSEQYRRVVAQRLLAYLHQRWDDRKMANFADATEHRLCAVLQSIVDQLSRTV